ncbi:uncharacterized protein [Haliotis cracherodii]|uniref:uncharacterized protein n=1 Tax=Haliotis cracherodii TaxID=6455 RepID=UPI0039EBF30D
MKGALVASLILVVVILTCTNVQGARVARKSDETPGWMQSLFSSLFGGGNDKKSGNINSGNNTGTLMKGLADMNLNETSNSSTSSPGSTSSSATTLSTTFSSTLATLSSSTVELSNTTSTTTISTQTQRNPECLKANDMTTYCEMSERFKQYMNHNTTSDAMAAKLFSYNVVDQLMKMCKPGEWCLSGDYIKAFADSMSTVFNGPICEKGLRKCIEQILYMRNGCPDMTRLTTLDNALSLVCEMYAVPELTPECFGHTLATLHVTLADELRQTSKKILQGGEFCLGAYVGMTRKFMCTMEKCPHHNQLFHNFVPWQWFMDDAPVIKQVCKLESVCGDLEAREEASSTTGMTMTTLATPSQIPPGLTRPSGELNQAGNDADTNIEKPFFIIQTTDENTRLLIGIITGTLVAMLGVVVLLCAVLKRVRRKGRPLLTKDGYTKLPSEEVH